MSLLEEVLVRTNRQKRTREGLIYVCSVYSRDPVPTPVPAVNIPSSLCIREKIPNSFIGNNFIQVCPFTLVIVLSGSSGCVIHSCNWFYFDNFFYFYNEI